MRLRGLVELFQLAGDPAPIVARLCLRAPGRAEPLPQRRGGGHAPQLGGQSVRAGVAGGMNEQAVFAVAHQGLQAAHAVDDDRPARAPGFEDYNAERLVPRGQHKHVASMEGIDQVGVIVAQAREDANATAKLIRADEFAELRGVVGLGLWADQQEERQRILGAKAGERFEQQ